MIFFAPVAGLIGSPITGPLRCQPKPAPSQHAGTATAGGKDKDVHTREKIGDAGELEKPAINQHARQRVSLRKDFVPSSFPPIHRNGYTAHRYLADVVACILRHRVAYLQRVAVHQPHARIGSDFDRAGGQDRDASLPGQHPSQAHCSDFRPDRTLIKCQRNNGDYASDIEITLVGPYPRTKTSNGIGHSPDRAAREKP
uniref:Uncharacterized protein n=1 Tax=Anopheles coluzzii TaxID=1518534 RepID=A0A8W7PRQ3_ANOCL